MAKPGSTHDRLVDGMAFGIPRVASDELFRGRFDLTDPAELRQFLDRVVTALLAEPR